MELMFEHSASIAKLAEALNKAQDQMEKAKKDSNNPFFKSRYADLSAVWDACKDAVLSNGFCVMQPLSGTDERGNTLIVTMLLHVSGEWIKGVLAIPATKPDPQQIGSAITYGRRYSLAAMLNVMLEDDDAEGAMERQNKAVSKPANKPVNNPAPKQVTQSNNAKATPKQVSYLRKLIDSGKVSEDAIEQAKINNKVETMSDLPMAVISQLINGAVAA